MVCSSAPSLMEQTAFRVVSPSLAREQLVPSARTALRETGPSPHCSASIRLFSSTAT